MNKYETNHSSVADITVEVPTLPGSISIHFGSSLPVHTSHVTTVGSSPEGFYHQNIIGKMSHMRMYIFIVSTVGVSTATATLVFLFVILGIVVWIYCKSIESVFTFLLFWLPILPGQWKKKGVWFCLHMYLFFFNLCIFNFQEWRRRRLMVR